MKSRFQILVILLLFCAFLTLETRFGSLSSPPISQGRIPRILGVKEKRAGKCCSPNWNSYAWVTEERSDRWKNEVVNTSPYGAGGGGGGVTRATIRVALLLVRGKIPTLEGLSCWLARSVPGELARRSRRLGSPSVLRGAREKAGSRRSRCCLHFQQERIVIRFAYGMCHYPTVKLKLAKCQEWKDWFTKMQLSFKSAWLRYWCSVIYSAYHIHN